jgi:mannose-6-phosphate isomerase-like protein (cupin superfamily)
MLVIEELVMSKIIRLDEAETRKALGGTLKVLFTPETANTQFSRCSMGYFSPGEQLAPHIHPESEEVYYVIQGRGTVYLGEELKEVPVEPHMGLYVPPGLVHGVKNTGDERLLIAFFVAPGKEASQIFHKD